MSLPAAAAPVAVLVLAWDEATPAVRTLVDAAATEPRLDSLLVLVPAAHSAAAALPHPAPPAEAAVLTAATAPAETAAPVETVAPAEAATPIEAVAPTEAAAPAETAASSFLTAEIFPPAAPRPTDALTGTHEATLPQATRSPAPAAVRVLHLSSFSLPALAELANRALPLPIWTGATELPVPPYAGSSVLVTGDVASFSRQYLDIQDIGENSHSERLPAELQLPEAAQATAESVLGAATLAIMADTGAAPVPAAAVLPSHTLDPDAAADADSPVLADAADEPAAALPPAELTSPAQAGWPEALAALREPLALEGPSAQLSNSVVEAPYHVAAHPADEPASSEAAPLAGQLVSQPFAAPNLNFQVIQYARFAVPVALAQAPFGVIYAPAWPTWLAAQELRQRTGLPLVLHVSTLAAGEAESVETAAGWQAELQRQALHRADLILTETATLADRLRLDLRLSAELVRPVPAAQATAIAQALHTARRRPAASAG